MDIAGFPYFPIEFAKDGGVVNPQQRTDILTKLPKDTTDLFVVSHGWNNDAVDAKKLYDRLFKAVRDALPQSPVKDRKFGIVGIFWPSKQFGEQDFSDVPAAQGGAKSLAGGGGTAEAEKRLEELAETLGPESQADVQRARAALKTIDKTASQNEYVEALREALRKDVGEADKDERKEDAADVFFTDKPSEIFDRLKVPPGVLTQNGKPVGSGGSQSVGSFKPGTGGTGQSAGGFFRTIGERASDIANFTTYYVMKKRAGTVGEKGVAPLLDDIRKTYPNVRIHTIGHSFGGRVVTAASGKVANEGAVASMTLLQAAYSHNGLGDNKKGLVGFFRSVVTGKRVKGPIVITHTKNDKAVGVAYPIASRLARDNSKAVGGRDDQYGGMGTNGALFADASDDLKMTLGVKSFKFDAGKIYNLEADPVIGGHSDITKPEVAVAILCAVATTG